MRDRSSGSTLVKVVTPQLSSGSLGGKIMRHKSYIVLIVCFFACSGTLVRNSAWFGLGLGSNYFGPTFSFNISYARNNNIFTLRYLKADEFQFNVEGHYDQPTLAFKEVGLLYGRCFKKGPLALSISAGIGYVNAADRGTHIQYDDYQRVEISTFGVPFEAGFRFEFGFVGIGGSWYGNINPDRSTFGAMVQASFGTF
jgi:hypothetical protein